MPILGFGVYQISDEQECKKSVTDAINIGYRLFDTAQAYGNEEFVGEALKKSGINRKDFFVVTKIWISNAGEEKAYKSIHESLTKLQMDYIDLLLIHQPFNDYYGTYRAMERAYKEHKVMAIGVSNFPTDRFIDLYCFAEIKPVINQIETHVFYQQKEARKYLTKYKTQIMAWGPLAEGKNGLFTNEILIKIAEKYNKTAAQIALKFLIHENIIIIPKSTNSDHMKQNFEIFDFELDDEDVKTINGLDLGHSQFFSHHDPATVELFMKWSGM